MLHTRKEVEDLIEALDHYKWCMKWADRNINDPQWDVQSRELIIKCKGEILIEHEKIITFIMQLNKLTE